MSRPDKGDYEAIHKNSAMGIITDPLVLNCLIHNSAISPGKIVDYVVRRTDVAFRRGYWKAQKESMK